MRAHRWCIAEVFCYSPDPTRSQERKRAASRAGRSSKANRELKEIKQRLKMVVEGVLAGRVKRADAIAVNQCLNTLLRALEMDHKWEAEERERRASEEGNDSIEELSDDQLIGMLYASEEASLEAPEH